MKIKICRKKKFQKLRLEVKLLSMLKKELALWVKHTKPTLYPYWQFLSAETEVALVWHILSSIKTYTKPKKKQFFYETRFNPEVASG